jgi:SM-20-related protein
MKSSRISSIALSIVLSFPVQYVVAWVPSNHLWATPLPRSRPSATKLFSATTLPRLSAGNIQDLKDHKYVVIPDFLASSLEEDLRDDVRQLRSSGKFNIAKIGQDATNALNTDIRVAETCFLGRDKLSDAPSPSREQLYQVLEQVRADLSEEKPLDDQLTELLYAYYPQGGFYRRHRDAIRGSASVLRTYSLLLYLNKDWDTAQDKGELRMHFDSGGDELPAGEEANYRDVEPLGGTLILFESDAFPHEVLDTTKERLAVVGWYNRPISVSDISNLSGDGGSTQLILLVVAAALVTVGVINLVS